MTLHLEPGLGFLYLCVVAVGVGGLQMPSFLDLCVWLGLPQTFPPSYSFRQFQFLYPSLCFLCFLIFSLIDSDNGVR